MLRFGTNRCHVIIPTHIRFRAQSTSTRHRAKGATNSRKMIWHNRHQLPKSPTREHKLITIDQTLKCFHSTQLARCNTAMWLQWQNWNDQLCNSRKHGSQPVQMHRKITLLLRDSDLSRSDSRDSADKKQP